MLLTALSPAGLRQPPFLSPDRALSRRPPPTPCPLPFPRQATGTANELSSVDNMMYIQEYDSLATIGDLPDRYVLVVGGEFYDEYNVTSNVTGYVVDALGNSSLGIVAHNVRYRPQLSSIFRPPTDR